MDLKTILNLSPNKESIAIIKNYLESTISSADFEHAVLKLINIFSYLHEYENVVQYCEKNKDRFEKNQNYNDLLKSLYDSYIKLSLYSKAINCLNERKRYCTLDLEHIINYDEIFLNKSLNKPYKDLLTQAINKNPPEKFNKEYYLLLIDLYIEEKDYISAKAYLKTFYNLYTDRLVRQELEILYQTNDDSLKEVSKYYYDNNISRLDSLIYLIRDYANNNKLSMAATLDSENTDLVSNCSDLYIKKSYYEICTDFYKKMNSKPSVEYNQRQLDDVIKDITKLEKEKLKNKKIHLENIKSSKVVVKDIFTTTPKETNKLTKILKPNFDKYYQTLNDLFLFDTQLNIKVSIIQYLRTLFIYINKSINIKYLELYTNTDNKVYMYKVERLYDKNIILSNLDNTLAKKCFDEKTDLVYTNDEIDNFNSLYTNEKYSDVNILASFYLENIGSLIVNLQSHEDIIFFRLLSSFLVVKLSHLYKSQRLVENIRFYENIIKSDILNTSIIYNDKYVINQKLADLFNISPVGYIQEIYNNMKSIDIDNHKKHINLVLNNINSVYDLEFEYNNRKILQRSISLYDNDILKVISTYFDKTSDNNKIDRLYEMATIDNLTKFYNEYKLISDFDSFINNKFSLLLISLKLKNESFYNENDIQGYFIEFSEYLRQYFSDAQFYKIGYKKFIIKININDIRSVTSLIEDFMLDVNNYQIKSIKYEKFIPYLGVIRYPAVTENKNYSKILQYLHIALNNSYTTKNRFCIFQKKDYDNEIFEQTIIKHINEALDHDIFSLSFIQIVDIESKKVIQYESEMQIKSYDLDYKYLVSLAKRRDKIYSLEKSHIAKVIQFLHTMKSKTNRLVKVTIPISYESFIEKDFVSYVFKLLKKYDIEARFIKFKLDFQTYKLNEISLKINELNQSNILLSTTNYNLFLEFSFESFYYKYKQNLNVKKSSYIKLLQNYTTEYHSNLILYNVSNNDDLKTLKKLSIKYITGNIYRSILPDEIIDKVLNSKNE